MLMARDDDDVHKWHLRQLEKIKENCCGVYLYKERKNGLIS
jgi:hypothetical protein